MEESGVAPPQVDRTDTTEELHSMNESSTAQSINKDTGLVKGGGCGKDGIDPAENEIGVLKDSNNPVDSSESAEKVGEKESESFTLSEDLLSPAEKQEVPGVIGGDNIKEDATEELMKKDVKDSPGCQSTVTTPASLSGQDSGISLISPDDSSSDTANNIGSKATPSLSDEMSETSSKEQLKGLDNDEENVLAKQQSTISSSAGSGHEQMSPSPDGTATSDSVTAAAGLVESMENAKAPDALAASASAKGADAKDATSKDQESVYYIKWIMFNQTNVPIITQNENGPCPLLAIMNVLLLNGKVKLAPMMEMVTSEQLMTYLGDCILESRPENLSEMTQANYEQNMQDAMGIMHKLQTGLDVNVKFSGVGEFEYTPECIIFDLLEISLYHGWLVDPQDSTTVCAVGQCSYNQLVESIITLKSSQIEDEQRKGLIAEQFLDRTASQLTYHGLCELSSVLKEKELCVFFRNNHFNTLYKHNNELFLLVTDQGFLTESNVVWETLCNVEGDGHFVNTQFRTYTKPLPSKEPIPDPSMPVGSPEQIDHDYQVALSLVQEEDVPQTTPTDWPTDQDARTLADHELAMRLQEQEHQSAMSQQQQQQRQQPQQQQQQQQQQQARAWAEPQQGGSQARSSAGAHGASGSQQDGRRRQEEPREKESKCSIL